MEMIIPESIIKQIRPKFGDYIYPLRSVFEAEGLNQLRGFLIETELVSEFLQRLKSMDVPPKNWDSISKVMAKKIALNPCNKQSKVTLSHWEKDFSLRIKYWYGELEKVERILIESAINTYDQEVIEFQLNLSTLRDLAVSDYEEEALIYLLKQIK
jgi:hypothetical protein